MGLFAASEEEMKAALLALFALIKLPLVRLLSSMKFWTVILAVVTTQAAKHGFEVDPTTYWTIVGLFTALLTGQALQDHGKERAKVEADMVAKASQGGFVSLEMLVGAMCALFIVGTIMSVGGCAWLKSEAKETGKAAIDCVADQAAKQAIAEFGPTVDDVLVNATAADGSIDRARVKSATRAFATNAAKCVLADAILRALKPADADPGAPKSSPLEASAAELLLLYAELAGGKVYRTEHGTL